MVKHLIRASSEFSLDCIILAELDIDEDNQLVAKCLKQKGYLLHLTPGCDKIKLFSRNKLDIKLHQQDSHFSVFSISGLIICAVHFPSKLHATKDRFRRFSERACEAIENAESVLRHKRSVIVGDFNMNPFDDAMTSFTGIGSTNLHSESEKEITRDGEKRLPFYNPTWALYERYKSKPGTFYYANPGSNMLNWHLIDQVIIRPALVPHFPFEKFEILQAISKYSLLKENGRPKPSDHLPLRFSINRKDI